MGYERQGSLPEDAFNNGTPKEKVIVRFGKDVGKGIKEIGNKIVRISLWGANRGSRKQFTTLGFLTEGGRYDIRRGAKIKDYRVISRFLHYGRKGEI